MDFSIAAASQDQIMLSYLKCLSLSSLRKHREREKDAGHGEVREKVGVVQDRSCESNYVLWNVIICDE